MSTSATPGSLPETSSENTAALSEGQRLINVFIAPSKTFADLKRKTNWIVPWLILVVAGYAFLGMVAQKVGFRQVVENQMRLSPKAQERMAQATPEQREQSTNVAVAITKGISFAIPIVSLLFYVVVGAVLMATFNFGMGLQVPFGTSFAIAVYSRLPELIKLALAVVSLLAGADPQSFNIDNPVATNLGFFVDPSAHLALYKLASAVDVFSLWVVVLLGIGFSSVAKVKRGTAIATVFAWYVLITLPGVAWAALVG